jgi:hypothetical protein
MEMWYLDCVMPPHHRNTVLLFVDLFHPYLWACLICGMYVMHRLSFRLYLFVFKNTTLFLKKDYSENESTDSLNCACFVREYNDAFV